MVEPIFDYQFRLILIGDSTVGKSSLLKYFTDGKFEDMCDPTVGVDFYARLIEVEPGVRVKLQLWDTAGQERFRSITRSYYRNSVGAIVMYDITKMSTFQHVDDWLEEAKLHIEPHKAVYMILGHKADMDKERVVQSKKAQAFADFHGLKFMETSAVTGQNVEEAFSSISRDIYYMLKKGEITVEEGWDGIKNGYSQPRDSLTLMEGDAESGGCC